MNLSTLLQEAVRQEASDLHLVVGFPPSIRANGQIVTLATERLTPHTTRELIAEILSQQQEEQFERDLELNFSVSMSGLGRFRVNLYRARGNLEAAFRLIEHQPLHWMALGLPPIVEGLVQHSSGLILITGPAGQGKTTSLAALIDLINRDRQCRIITIEDPIEYLHRNINSIVIQREVGSDTKSFHHALANALRQDPNVICIGEMRDLETISTALTAAETGHLILATLHSPGTIQAVERIVDVFPSTQQQQIRLQLSSCLLGILSQRLIPAIDRKPRALAVEILLGKLPVRNVIRDGRLHHLTTYLDPSMGEAVQALYQQGAISAEATNHYDTDLVGPSRRAWPEP